MKKTQNSPAKNKKELPAAKEAAAHFPKFLMDENGTLQVNMESEEQRINFLNLLGTTESKTAIQALTQIVSFISEGNGSLSVADKINAVLPMIKAINPKDDLEGMLSLQMIGVHHMTMEVIKRGMLPNQTVDGVTSNVNRTTKLARTFIAQLDALNKHRSKGQQKMTVEHVHVNKGGQAVIGSVEKGGG